VYAAVIVLSLALGIGANTAIFTLINAVFLQPLPVADPSRLISVYTSDPRNSGYLPTSYQNYRDIRDKNTVFSSVAASIGVPLALSTEAHPEQVFGALASGNYFDTLGVKAVLGRTFLPEEDSAPGAHPIVVLSHAFWTREYGANAQVIGQKIKLNGRPYTVIGIAPPNFNGTTAIGGPSIWAPLAMYRELMPQGDILDQRRFLSCNVVGRLRPDTSIGQAQAALQTLAKQLEKEYPRDNEGRGVKLVPLTQSVLDPNAREDIVSAGSLLMCLVGLVLLIACANVANLQMVRAAGRRKEIAVRLSMGASKWRLIQQLLTESMLYSLLGGLLGLVIADWGRQVLWSFRPPFLQANDLNLAFDSHVFWFTATISILTGLLFGLAPTMQSTRPDLVSELKERTSQAAHGNSRFSLRQLLVISQVALSLVALVGAGLFLRSLRKAQEIDPGFASSKLASVEISPGAQDYTPARAQLFYRQVLERVQATPGVQSASVASMLPMGFGGFARSVFLEGQQPSAGNRGVLVLVNDISARYFETMGIPFLRGRAFNDSDRQGTTHVTVINETMAKKFWPGQDAVGKRFHFFGDASFTEVVGVVKDSKLFRVSENPRTCAYLPIEQDYSPRVSVVVRAAGDPAVLLGTVARQVQSLDRNLLLTNPFTMQDLISRTLWAARMGAGLLAVFGLLALLLSTVGVYGVMAYTVTQRTSELGIRMALGAKPADMFWMVIKEASLLVGSGVLLGVIAALSLGRLVSNLLLGVSATDPGTFVVTSILLSVVALIASLVPARRATSIDPLVALRVE
jgi:predicted permease